MNRALRTAATLLLLAVSGLGWSAAAHAQRLPWLGEDRGGYERNGGERGGHERADRERAPRDRGGPERRSLDRGGAERGGFDRGGAERGGHGQEVTLGQAVAAVRGATGGRVLSAETHGANHRIKVLLPGGRVRVYSVDARTGAGMP